MAITVNIYYSGANGNARKFAEEMVANGIVAAIRAENGNLKYEYFFSPMMSKIIAFREKYDLHMRVERYVSDEAGIPETDKSFIKD